MIRFIIITPFAALALSAAPPDYSVSWLGNSFSGASNKWVQNFLIHTHVQSDGTVNTWSHWDEGGKKFGVYKDGDVIGNTNTNPNSLETTDKTGRKWKIEFDYAESKFHEYDFKPRGASPAMAKRSSSRGCLNRWLWRWPTMVNLWSRIRRPARASRSCFMTSATRSNRC